MTINGTYYDKYSITGSLLPWSSIVSIDYYSAGQDPDAPPGVKLCKGEIMLPDATPNYFLIPDEHFDIAIETQYWKDEVSHVFANRWAVRPKIVNGKRMLIIPLEIGGIRHYEFGAGIQLLK